MKGSIKLSALPQSFYHTPTLDLAKALIGKILVHQTDEDLMGGQIVETEAYLGITDRAAHSFNNKRTKRTEIMYKTPGHIYMYQMHTHHLLNVVSGEENNPEAILIRAVEPVVGRELMEKNRPVQKAVNLTNGPGKLTKAFGITMDYYGASLTKSKVFISEAQENYASIKSGPRIGIPNIKEAKDYPYRFWIQDNPYVSR